MKIEKKINANILKWVALITMFIDHIGAGILEKCYMPALKMEDNIIRGIGRLAFPIFCFLLVEGYNHTRKKWKYAMNLFVFALISEVPFDFLFRGKISWGYQNVYFTLLIGLLVIMAAGEIDKKQWKLGFVLEIIVLIVGCLLAYAIHTDYSYWGVGLIYVLYVAEKCGRAVQCIAGAIYMLTKTTEMVAVVSFILIFFYNGERKNRVNKYVFYSLYPIHITIYCVIRYLIAGF